MSLTPGALWITSYNQLFGGMTYERDVDDEWYPLSFFDNNELFFIIQCENGVVHNATFRPPEALTTVLTVISSIRGLTHTSNYDIVNCCELLSSPNET